MSRFATVLRDENGTDRPVLVWEESDGRRVVVSRHASLDEVDPEIETFAFEVPTTMGKGGTLNSGFYPTVDVDGAPLWKGARIEFRVPSHYVNTEDGHGSFVSVDRYGGTSYVSDVALPIRRAGGGHGHASKNRYSAWNGFDRDGELTGHRRLAGGLGDPHEHGVTGTFVRLTSDPREVCVPVPRNAPAGP